MSRTSFCCEMKLIFCICRLTAISTRALNEATQFIYVDPQVVINGVDWLVDRQNKDGSFNEFGRVLDSSIQVPQNKIYQKKESVGRILFFFVHMLGTSALIHRKWGLSDFKICLIFINALSCVQCTLVYHLADTYSLVSEVIS